MQRAWAFMLCAATTVGCDVPEVDAPPSASDFSFPTIDPADVGRPPEAVLDSFVGCYEFAVRIGPGLADGEIDVVRAELRKVQLQNPNEFELLLTPKPRLSPRWMIRQGEAVFWWSTGYVGLAFRMTRGGADPEAVVGEFADAGPKIHPAFSKVNVKSIPCVH